MASSHLALIFAAFSVYLFISPSAADLSDLSCPETCSVSRRTPFERQCVKYAIIGCFPRECITDEGRQGFTCAIPTPVPTACPGTCISNEAFVNRQCRILQHLRCSVQNCEIPASDGGSSSSGFSCADPTPTPLACTDMCRRTRRQANLDCSRLALLGCSVSRCIFDVEGPSRIGFTCSTPTPTPTACPNACMETRSMARRQCRAVAALGLGCSVRRCRGDAGFICANRNVCPERCAVGKESATRSCGGRPSSLGCRVERCDRGFGSQRYTCATPTPTPTACPGVCYATNDLASEECRRVNDELDLGCAVEPCAGPEGTGFSCGTPVISPMSVVTIDNVPLGEDFKFNLNLSVSEGSGVGKEDLYLLTDATGSMNEEIATVQDRFMEIVAARSLVSSEVHFGVGFYRDEADGFDNGFNNLQSITNNLTAVQAAINSLTADAGGDGPEANLVALYRLATDPSIGWRTGSRRIIVMLGDIPGHEPTCIPGAPELRRLNVRNALIAQDITLVAVSFNPGLDQATFSRGCPGSVENTGTGQSSFIATGTGGAFVPSTTADLISTIEDTVGNLSLTFEVNTSDCDGVLTSTYDPSFPIEVESGSSVTVCQVISLLPGVCDAGSSFECEIRYTASGADMGLLRVRTSNITCS